MSRFRALCATWQDRQAVYTDAGLPVVWDRARLPLPLVVQLDPGQAGLLPAIREALSLWNRELGLRVLQEVSHPDLAVVFITSGSCTDPGVAATTHSGDVVPESATVELRAVASLSEGLYAAAHELGHVLGLADGTSGVMAPMPEDFDASRMYCLPTDDEIEYLRSVYRR